MAASRKMYTVLFEIFFLFSLCRGFNKKPNQLEIDLYDLTNPTSWKDLVEYYTALEKQLKICYNCGQPRLGTVMHLEYTVTRDTVQPAVIPTEFLVTRLTIIDVNSLATLNPNLPMSLEVARQWLGVAGDPTEPTLLLFKFGWIEDPRYYKRRKCVCQVTGLSYELAQWIAANMSHVVGVATDAPSLESEQTRQLSARTVTSVFGRHGIYIIENVNVGRKLPEAGCLAIAMPMKLFNKNYVPTRLTAFCPPAREHRVTMMLKSLYGPGETTRSYDVNLDEIMKQE